ncbi:MAG: hypothetical protein M3441_03640 [Chloroflexota bacterium]|nr:hypothetical protein [Chloroflexota bacterium]
MGNGAQFTITTRTARDIVSLLHINPQAYDAPPYNDWWGTLVAGQRPEPWSIAMLNPQPLPPRVAYALTLASAHIQEVLTLDKMGALLGGEAADRAGRQAVSHVVELDELCPRWPPSPRFWRPWPRPNWELEEMTTIELTVFGLSFLAASEFVEHRDLQKSLVGLGQKALDLSMQG